MSGLRLPGTRIGGSRWATPLHQSTREPHAQAFVNHGYLSLLDKCSSLETTLSVTDRHLLREAPLGNSPIALALDLYLVGRQKTLASKLLQGSIFSTLNHQGKTQ